MLLHSSAMPLPLNERMHMLDRAMSMIGLFSPVHEMERELTKHEKRAYENALGYIAKEFARGWRSESDCVPNTPPPPELLALIAKQAAIPVTDASEDDEEEASAPS